ncbi:hypothetical protein [Micromonospora cathayae]|uniref:Osmoprotectant transport system permease protein n=1 Tax=Micromonospora cathayae TaxID=3028804 RepID=A0ABY7ZNE8_9ACTN|nr:hypothetical protein [Micromonospora sp. HUAS 3]WDZ84545.1 hypothetical protein PVK37_29610 [Micromonospora sp. HUAS 3]
MWNAGERDTADRSPAAPPGSRSAANRIFAYLVLLAWHGLVVVGFLVLVDRQSGMRVNHGNSPQEDMWIFGVTIGAPVLFGTLLVGLTLLKKLLTSSRITSGIVLGTVAAAPALLFVAVAAVPVLR